MQLRVHSSLALGIASVIAVALSSAPVGAQSACGAPSWAPGFGAFDGGVTALVEHDDGTGKALYAGGHFTHAGGTPANHVARWDGSAWHALGSGVEGSGPPFTTVSALASFDDGDGAALYAAGPFMVAGGVTVNHVAKWDGSAWSALGSGANGDVVTLAVWNDGQGDALFAGGRFTSVGGQVALNVAKWDGETWSALGNGLADDVLALTVHDDGRGPALFAGGEFTSDFQQALPYAARWDGTSWAPLAEIGDAYSRVTALASFDDGNGPALIATGTFEVAGGVLASNIARWDGAAWSALGGGLSYEAFALHTHDDGDGAALYAVGAFSSAGGAFGANGFASWDGLAWTPLGAGIDWAGFYSDDSAMLSVASANGPALLVGSFFGASPAGDSHLARWGCPAGGFVALAGCAGNPAVLASPSSGVAVGDAFTLELHAAAISTGVAALYFGADGAGVGGCGLVVPGLGEVLLALVPSPVALGFAAIASGEAAFTLPVPPDPSLAGLAIAFQGAAIGILDPGAPLELTNGLATTIGP